MVSITKRILLSANFWTVFVLAVTGAVIVGSALDDDWHWFQRSGAFIVLSGVALGARRMWRLGIEELFRERYFTDLGTIREEPGTGAEADQHRLDVEAASRGIKFVIAGTIIATFGDLLDRLI